MNKNKFIETVVEELERRNPAISFEVERICKPNDTYLYGLRAKSNDNIAPVIYLDDYYYRYVEDEIDLNVIIKRINHVIQEAMLDMPKDNVQSIIDTFGNYEDVKEKLYVAVWDYERNKNWLKDKAYIKWVGELVIAARIHICMGDEIGTVHVTTALLNTWNVSFETVLKDAKYNSFVRHNTTIIPMADMLNRLGVDVDLPDEPPVFVASNESNCYGASVICDTLTLKQFADEQNSDFYIIPSSIHELLLVPVNGDNEPEELKKMVREVNETAVKETEILSDDVFRFWRKDSVITLA